MALHRTVLRRVTPLLHNGEKIVWSDSADVDLQFQQEKSSTKDRLTTHVTTFVVLGYFSYLSWRWWSEDEYARLIGTILVILLIFWVVAFSNGYVKNPFHSNDNGSQYHHYLVTNERLLLFRHDKRKWSEYLLKDVSHAFIMRPKTENYLTISFLNDPDEDRMISLNGVADFSPAVEAINFYKSEKLNKQILN